MRKQKKKVKQRTRSQYNLSDIREKISNGTYLIRSNATDDAFNDFGWEHKDIEEAYNKLKPKHFCKTDPHKSIPNTFVDVYKAHNLRGEDIYTHFYVNNSGELIINSLKKL